jgi:hypothetical protein
VAVDAVKELVSSTQRKNEAVFFLQLCPVGQHHSGQRLSRPHALPVPPQTPPDTTLVEHTAGGGGGLERAWQIQ